VKPFWGRFREILQTIFLDLWCLTNNISHFCLRIYLGRCLKNKWHMLHNDHVDRVRLCLWTAATTSFSVHPHIHIYIDVFHNMPWKLTAWDRRISCPPNVGVLRIFIDIKSLLPSAGFEPANFGFSGRHTKHYTTENDCTLLTTPLSYHSMTIFISVGS
jgi:hypothetical protein